MRKSDFRYELPESLIAQAPLPRRDASRLLHLNGADGDIADLHFTDLPNLLRTGDLLVCNDTRVMPARLFGTKTTGGKVELLVERILCTRTVLAHVRASKAPRPGSELLLEDGFRCRVNHRQGDWFELEFGCGVDEVLRRVGHIPLPPYIARTDAEEDRERYQTVFARTPGAVAAPTAGLHFDESMLARLENLGVERAFVTLHVGSGTFQPVRVENLDQHLMHSEPCEVGPEVVEAVARTRARGGRVVAVGTTVVRSLETAAASGELAPYLGETRLFIRPGFRFRCVDAMLTNFHLPESTLLVLVCAFAGYEETLRSYCHAVKWGYRFFSYGDAMFVTRRNTAPGAEVLPGFVA